MRIIAALTFSLFVASCTSSAGKGTAQVTASAEHAPKVVGEEVTYEAGGATLKGYLAYDAHREGKRPGVLVVHEWWGHNDYARKRADMLAELGYTALAVDMYGDGRQAAHPGDAQKFMKESLSDLNAAKARFVAGKTLLENHDYTDATKVAAIGYCFGGAVVLHMARFGVDLDAVASFHGNLSTQTPAKTGEVKAKVLVLHGAADPFVPAEQIEAFRAEMKAAGVPFDFEAYEGAKHAFTNPAATENGQKFEIPLEYNADADRKSWARMKAFFEQVFSES